VFMEIGAHTGAGLALGLASSGDGVSRAARNLADRVSMSARQRLSASAVGSSTPDPDALASAVRGALHGARLDLGPVNVAAPSVHVFIGDEEVTGRVRVVVRDEIASEARAYRRGVR